MPPTIDDFSNLTGWTFTTESTPPLTYPPQGRLMITSGDGRHVSLAWQDSTHRWLRLEGILFHPETGRIDGPTGDGRHTVTIDLERPGRLSGRVDATAGTRPEAGTWGADVNGGPQEGGGSAG